MRTSAGILFVALLTVAGIASAQDALTAAESALARWDGEEAYRLAQDSFVQGGVNRVMLATDGDFNVGQSDDEDLKRIIEEKRKSGVFLSVFGFGRGNLNDRMMQTIAQNGNGTAAYIDTLAEAEKVLVEDSASTLFPIAKDVKIQVEFNPAAVSEYRLIGYETRALNREDFNNDAVDAGDIGAGHTVTAIYEITPAGSEGVLVDPLRYGQTAETPVSTGQELAFLKMRFKLPDSDVSQLIQQPVTADMVYGDIADVSDDMRFAAAVAAFGQKLKGSVYGTAIGWDDIAELVRSARGADESGYRAEFLSLVKTASLLKPDTHTDPCDTAASGEVCE